MRTESKPYELIIEVRADYLYARITADAIDRHTANEYLQRIASECVQHTLNKVLIDRRIPMMMSDADNYLLIMDMARFLGRRKIAFVNPFEQIDAKMELSEVMSRNRNVPYRVFRNEEDAIAWLENDAPDVNMHLSDG
ncbi:MAG: hypothetical protein KF756_11950 [Acidobacteria bacterium]|nr:hypothetical protein [Acidobacteriota bacterium]